ncbi:Reverse transcriptase domain - like 10 [Theobroma cacao]|nr:Reverse transcriptase domain - like 10 [Theobroma cacao]
MRVFRWSPDLHPEKESPIVPVWISFPNLRAHLQERSALMMIAKTVGKPLFVDEATTNGSRPSVARVCVEYDCQKPPLDHVWIVSRDRKSGVITGGFAQQVEFAKLPNYCSHCCHVGHDVSVCMVLGRKPEKQGAKKPQQRNEPQGDQVITRQTDAGDANTNRNDRELNLEKRKVDLLPRPEQLPRTQELKSAEKGEERVSVPKGAVQQDGVRVYATKQGKKWQAVGTSSAKNSKGAEIIVPTSKQAQTMVSNRFDAIQEEAMEKQKNPEKQGQTETNSAHTNAENNSSGQSNWQTGETSIALQAEGGEAFHADEQGADESTSHDDRAQKNSAIVSFRLTADAGQRTEHAVNAFMGKKNVSGELLGKDESQKNEILQNEGIQEVHFLQGEREATGSVFTHAWGSKTVDEKNERADAVLLDHIQCLHVKLNMPWLEVPLLASFIYAKCISGERLNRAVPHAGSMEDFAIALLDCGLMDGGYEVEGEHNTKFFHMRVKKKRIKSHIFKIQNSDERWIEEVDAVKSSAMEFFSSLMKKETCDMSRFDTSLISTIIFENDNLSLCVVLLMEEMKEAVFNIDKDSVAGLNGFTSYQQCWDIIANDLLDAVVDFFHEVDLPRGLTSTTIVLLPKNNNALKWSDFRLISLCNVLNKIITKILANRLAKVLPSMIIDNQSGFVGGRLISDNILLAQELIGKIDRKSRGGNVTIKLDMMKAYDRLE